MRVLIVGANSGIGNALIRLIQERYRDAHIYGTWYQSYPTNLEGVELAHIDASNELDIRALAEQTGDLDWLINTVGLLHIDQLRPEKTVTQFDADFFNKNIKVNTLPSLFIAKYFRPAFKHNRPAHFATISAKVGSISDNRLGGWYSYRISKAALNMALKTISVEWQRSLPQVCVSALHPGTTDTRLSKPFQSNVPEGKLFSPQKTAGFIVDRLEKITAENTGNFWSWNGEKIPW